MTKTVKRMSLSLGIGLLALGMTASAHAFTQNTTPDSGPFSRMMRPGGPGRGGPMGMLPMLGRRLGLTSAQRDQIKNIVETHRVEWKGLADRARTAHQALNAAVTADPINESLIRLCSADVAAIDADVAVARAHARAEILPLLTADQTAQLKAMQAKMKNRMKRG